VTLIDIEKRLRVLEQVVFARSEECNCRAGQKTWCHNAKELAKIIAVICPVHRIRDLGELICIGRGLPLLEDDRQFCSCPPSPLRALLMGRDGALSDAEQQQEEQRWWSEYGPGSDFDFRRDQEWVKKMLRIYEFNKSRRK